MTRNNLEGQAFRAVYIDDDNGRPIEVVPRKVSGKQINATPEIIKKTLQYVENAATSLRAANVYWDSYDSTVTTSGMRNYYSSHKPPMAYNNILTNISSLESVANGIADSLESAISLIENFDKETSGPTKSYIPTETSGGNNLTFSDTNGVTGFESGSNVVADDKTGNREVLSTTPVTSNEMPSLSVLNNNNSNNSSNNNTNQSAVNIGTNKDNNTIIDKTGYNGNLNTNLDNKITIPNKNGSKTLVDNSISSVKPVLTDASPNVNVNGTSNVDINNSSEAKAAANVEAGIGGVSAAMGIAGLASDYAFGGLNENYQYTSMDPLVFNPASDGGNLDDFDNDLNIKNNRSSSANSTAVAKEDDDDDDEDKKKEDTTTYVDDIVAGTAMASAVGAGVYAVVREINDDDDDEEENKQTETEDSVMLPIDEYGNK